MGALPLAELVVPANKLQGKTNCRWVECEARIRTTNNARVTDTKKPTSVDINELIRSLILPANDEEADDRRAIFDHNSIAPHDYDEDGFEYWSLRINIYRIYEGKVE